MISKLDMIEEEINWIDDEHTRLRKEKNELLELYCNLYHEVKKLNKHIIYVGCDLMYKKKDDVLGFAVAEDGTGLAQHLSSSESFSQHDMGITSSNKHDIYTKHYPDGYELKWVGTSTNIPADVLEKNRKLHAEHEAKKHE